MRSKVGKDLHAFCNLKENEELITVENNGMIVVPGTIQGGFKTKLLNIEEFFEKTLN